MKGIFEKKLSKDFHRAFELRQTFDYKVIKDIGLGKATGIYQKAVVFVKEVDKYLL